MEVDLKMVAERSRRSRGMGIKSILLMIELRQGLRFTCLFFLTNKGIFHSLCQYFFAVFD